MKTVIIFNDTEAELRFAVVDGDYSHLDGVYINSGEDNEVLQERLSELVYDQDTGEVRIKFQNKFPVKAVRDGAEVIVCGFYG